MLQNTFCHVPGVGPKTERKLWEAGLLSWQAARDAAELPICRRRAASVTQHVEESIRRLAERDAGYFYGLLPSSEQWRLFPEFRSHVAYLDIETTGLGAPDDYITTIALYDGRDVRWYVHDENLDEFLEDVERYELIVTYNGKTFDVPWLRDRLGAPMGQAHIDLRYVLGSLGLRGGLKGCERQVGIERGELEGVDGFFAVLLWRDYLASADRRALETLLAYNIADTVNLERLMVLAYNMKVRQTPLARRCRLPAPQTPALPFRAHGPTVRRLRRQMGRI